ncbi:MAG: hypothetical protein ACWA6U_07655 [Breznakibacter sp.]
MTNTTGRKMAKSMELNSILYLLGLGLSVLKIGLLFLIRNSVRGLQWIAVLIFTLVAVIL